MATNDSHGDCRTDPRRLPERGEAALFPNWPDELAGKHLRPLLGPVTGMKFADAE
jgi:hypothetical protein